MCQNVPGLARHDVDKTYNFAPRQWACETFSADVRGFTLRAIMLSRHSSSTELSRIGGGINPMRAREMR
eukprot:2432961-Pyramimonas_sp.AAC.2